MEIFFREFLHSHGNNNSISAVYQSIVHSEFISHAEVCMDAGRYFSSRLWPNSLYHVFQRLQCFILVRASIEHLHAFCADR